MRRLVFFTLLYESPSGHVGNFAIMETSLSNGQARSSCRDLPEKISVVYWRKRQRLPSNGSIRTDAAIRILRFHRDYCAASLPRECWSFKRHYRKERRFYLSLFKKRAALTIVNGGDRKPPIAFGHPSCGSAHVISRQRNEHHAPRVRSTRHRGHSGQQPVPEL